MGRFRAAIDELVDKVKEAIQGEPKSPVEILLDQHLSLDDEAMSFSPKNCTAVAVPTNVLNDFAARTKNVVDYPFIMERIWEILIDYQHDPNLLKKALNLLHYLLINGAIQVLKDCQDAPRMTFLDSLALDYNRYEFEQYQFSQHLDVGAGVRKTAAEIYHLLANERELFHARRQAEKLHQSLSDRGLRGSPAGSFSSLSPPDSQHVPASPAHDIRPPRYTDSYGREEDDVGLKIVTHPDELFEDRPLERSTSAKLPARRFDHPSDDYREGRATVTTTRGRSRKQHSQRTDGVEIKEELRHDTAPTPTTESVDLLGLESLGLEASSATAVPSPQGVLQTQSARSPPRQFTATI